MSEKLKLVRSFDELKAGMIVVVKGCLACHGTCRGICISLYEANDAETGEHLGPGWDVYPPCTPDKVRPGETNWIGPDVVRKGKVYRVVDGLETTKMETTYRPLERVR